MESYTSVPWSPGEKRMHELLGVPHGMNPAAQTLTPQASFMLENAPLLVMGTLGNQGRVWSTVWGGEPGFAMSLGRQRMVDVLTTVELKYDPVVEALASEFGGKPDQAAGTRKDKMFSGLTIDLMSRNRVKIAGRVMAVGLGDKIRTLGGNSSSQPNALMRFRVDESLGNCPKYISCKEVFPVTPEATLVSDSSRLPQEALDLINRADMFFVSTHNGNQDMDSNIRGGPPGFVRVASNSDQGAVVVWPEYSGNRLYSTLGNLLGTPRAGLVFPDFDTGDVLYLTGTTRVLIGPDAEDILPRSNLAVKLTIDQARFVRRGLPFRGEHKEFSPYNPDLRLLASEGNVRASLGNQRSTTAEMVTKELITPTVSRYTFKLSHPTTIRPGQWVAMDFSRYLDRGYSHMRDNNPKSLNDDYIRTFTVSSQPEGKEDDLQNEFQVTARTSGPVTTFLRKRVPASATLEVPVLGFGGDFTISTTAMDDEARLDDVPFIAGGVGITPVLGQLGKLDLSRFRLYWTIRFEDLDLVMDTLKRYPTLGPRTRLYFTNVPQSADPDKRSKMEHLNGVASAVHSRRLQESDLTNVRAKKWYICAGKELRTTLLRWLNGQTVVFESFDY